MADNTSIDKASASTPVAESSAPTEAHRDQPLTTSSQTTRDGEVAEPVDDIQHRLERTTIEKANHRPTSTQPEHEEPIVLPIAVVPALSTSAVTPPPAELVSAEPKTTEASTSQLELSNRSTVLESEVLQDGNVAETISGHAPSGNDSVSHTAPPLPLADHTALPASTTPSQAQAEEEQWMLKTIVWPPLPPTPSADSTSSDPSSSPSPPITTIKIICQNLNGPCSFIALCNILLLGYSISISSTRSVVSYSYLSSILIEYLLATTADEHSISVALSTLPSTRYGLELNPRFGSIDGFVASSAVTLFEAFKIPLLHGWTVDPDDAATWEVVVENAGDYDTLVERIVKGQVLSGGSLEAPKTDEEAISMVDKSSKWSEEEAKAVREAHVLSQFLSSTSTQLTYPGLTLLSSQLPTSSLSSLFRNSHVSVLYRRPPLPDPHKDSTLPRLFTLVTDSAFAEEETIVWESLEDVDGSGSDFYDGFLRRAVVRDGDYVGRRARNRRSVDDVERVGNDEDLARQLQYEEEGRERRIRQEEDDLSRRNEIETALREEEGRRGIGPGALAKGEKEKEKSKEKKKKKEKDCMIM